MMRLRVTLLLSIVAAGWLFAQSHTESPALELGEKRGCELPTGGLIRYGSEVPNAVYISRPCRSVQRDG